MQLRRTPSSALHSPRLQQLKTNKTEMESACAWHGVIVVCRIVLYMVSTSSHKV
jgi:hypothetical protein